MNKPLSKCTEVVLALFIFKFLYVISSSFLIRIYNQLNLTEVALTFGKNL